MMAGHERKNVKQRICPHCGSEFENFDFYVNGEFKFSNTDDLCFSCKMKKEDEEMVRKFMEKREKRKNLRFDRISVLPVDLDGASLENYYPKNESQVNALETVKSYVSGELDRKTLFFQGDTGIGKTHLSYAVYEIFKSEGYPAIFIDLPSLLSSIRETYNNDGPMTQERIMNLITECELFVLDDIGAEYVKPDANGFESWAADILFQIANSRQGKKNIYTTNFSSKYLNQKYGMMSKRIISRLMNNARIIKMEGNDHRLEGLL